MEAIRLLARGAEPSETSPGAATALAYLVDDRRPGSTHAAPVRAINEAPRREDIAAPTKPNPSARRPYPGDGTTPTHSERATVYRTHIDETLPNYLPTIGPPDVQSPRPGYPTFRSPPACPDA